MKFHINVECTPEEARTFLGLPNVVPMQEALMAQLQAKLEENIRTLDPETLIKTWMPAMMQGVGAGLGEMQKMFWSHMSMTPTATPRSDDSDD